VRVPPPRQTCSWPHLVFVVAVIVLLAACADRSESSDAHDPVPLAHGFGCPSPTVVSRPVTPQVQAEATCTVGGQRIIVDVWRSRSLAATTLKSASTGCPVAAQWRVKEVWIVSHVNWSVVTASQHSADLLHETFTSKISSTTC
jgi:hypothetical protein